MAEVENIILKRTDSTEPGFLALVKDLDAFLWETYGDEMNFYDQFNKVDLIKNVVVAYSNNIAAGCGAFKIYSADTVEVKRMFVKPQYRGKRIAGSILDELQNWAKQLGYTYALLETGNAQTEAIALYKKMGYQEIENYGEYATDAPSSICFKKVL